LRTNDEDESPVREARVDEDPSDLLVPLHPLSFSNIRIDVVRPLEAHSQPLVALHAPDSLNDGETEEVLDEDDLGRIRGGKAGHEGELKAARWGDPRVTTATATGDLVRGEADETGGESREEIVISERKGRETTAMRALVQRESREIRKLKQDVLVQHRLCARDDFAVQNETAEGGRSSDRCRRA
jgi:hypothetical protein